MKKFQYTNECYAPIVPDEIKCILNGKFDIPDEEISSSAEWENLGLDSLDVVELTMEVEKEYGIVLPDLEIEKCYTLGDFVKLVEKIKGED
jgi:acyl carrier protein